MSPESRRHAEFRWQDNELHIVDMESLNGTYVNPSRWSVMLVNGDEIRIGKFRLCHPELQKRRRPDDSIARIGCCASIVK
jgi:pSer/pThr/pTyr-binding forkhead associated (FHA) protein